MIGNFRGGPLHGQLIEQKVLPPEWRTFVPNPCTSIDARGECVSYTLREYRTPDGCRRWFYVLDGLSDTEVDKLLGLPRPT